MEPNLEKKSTPETSQNPEKSDTEIMGSVIKKIQDILIELGPRKDEIQQRVDKVLKENKVSFRKIHVGEDKWRPDGRDFCDVIVRIPKKGPNNEDFGEEDFFSCSVPDNYQPKEHP